MAGRQLPLLGILVPFWIVFIMDGLKGVRETWPAILVCGVSFSVGVFLTSNFIGPELPDIISALFSLICITLFLKVWKPKNIFRFKQEGEEEMHSHDYTGGQIVRAWSPFLLLTFMVIVWSLKPFKALFASGGALSFSNLTWKIPNLHELVMRTPPIVPSSQAVPAVYTLNLVSATGTAILVACLLSLALLRVRPAKGAAIFGETLRDLKWPVYTIGSVLGFAFVANASGLSTTLALLLAGTGKSFTFFSPILGWLGVFLTGSDTSSNALFAALQATTAHQTGLSDVLMVAANSTGGVTGKMISPQSIAVACAAVGLVGQEGRLFRFTLGHSVLFVVIIGVITTLQAYLFPWMIP
jgi:L-lactate permease